MLVDTARLLKDSEVVDTITSRNEVVAAGGLCTVST